MEGDEHGRFLTTEPRSARRKSSLFPGAGVTRLKPKESQRLLASSPQSETGRNLAPAPNRRLEAAITGTLGNVPLHRGGRHLCLPVSAASSRVIRWPGCGVKLRG